MAKIPFRTIAPIFCLLLSFICLSVSKGPVKNIGNWDVDKPLGKSTRLEDCGGSIRDPDLYWSLFWSYDKLMLVKEAFGFGFQPSVSSIVWQISLQSELQGAVFWVFRANPCKPHVYTLEIVAAKSPYYWVLLCDKAGCLVDQGPIATPTNDPIEYLQRSVFPMISPSKLEVIFITSHAAYQVQISTGLVSRAYFWNSTSFSSGFEPLKVRSAAESASHNVHQLSVTLDCKQTTSPYSEATCVVAMGRDPFRIDSTTLYSATTANFHFHNVTSQVSWTDSAPGQGIVTVYSRGKNPGEPLQLPFARGEIWAGPNWRDQRHENSLLASYEPGKYSFALWYIYVDWNRATPRVRLLGGPIAISGTEVPILPHPRGHATGFIASSTLALAYNPTTNLYEVNVYYAPALDKRDICLQPRPGFYVFNPNCRPSSCDIESRGDCPDSSTCFGTSAGVFNCCRGPPI